MDSRTPLRLATAAFAASCLLIACHKRPPTDSPSAPFPRLPDVNASGRAHWVGAGARPDSFKLNWGSKNADFVLIPDLSDKELRTEGAIDVPTTLSGVTIGAFQYRGSLSLKRADIKIQHEPATDSYDLTAEAAVVKARPFSGPDNKFFLPKYEPHLLVRFVYAFFQKRNFTIRAELSEGIEGDYVFTTDFTKISPEEQFVERRIRYQLIVEDNLRPPKIKYLSVKQWLLLAQIQKRGRLERTWQDDPEYEVKPLLRRLAEDIQDEFWKNR